MARLPDHFDLWVRKARQSPDVARQVDYILGAMTALKEWHFLNVGRWSAPRAADTQIGTDLCLLVFTDFGRVEDMMKERGDFVPDQPLPIISLAAARALSWCVARRSGVLVNPGEYAALIPFAQVEAYYNEWVKRGGQQPGYWIPNMSTEEEDFWQQHGL
jgi:hypothetical protein